MAQARKGKQPPPSDDVDDDGDDGEFTDAQLGRITGIVNAAVSGQLQRKLPKAISDGISGPIGELKTLLEQNGSRGRQRAANDDDTGDDEDVDAPPPPRKGKRGRTEDPEKENMRRRLDAIEAERKTEREQNAARIRDGEMREHLTKAGVDANRIRGAIAVLRESTKRDEKTGEWSYVAKRDGGYEEELDLSAGVAEWAKTDEGKSYIAAPTQGARGGSGTRVQAGGQVIGAAGGGRPAASGGDPKAAKAAKRQEAVAALTDGVNQLAGGAINIG